MEEFPSWPSPGAPQNGAGDLNLLDGDSLLLDLDDKTLQVGWELLTWGEG